MKIHKRTTSKLDAKLESKGLTRRQFLWGTAAGVTTLAGLGAFGALFRDISDEGFETFYVGDDDECEEKIESVTVGELCAHIGCAISLSAIDNEDYNEILRNLNLYGYTHGLYTYDGGRIMNHLHDDSSWCMQQPYYQVGRTDNKRGDIFVFGLDEMPNTALPNANNYINWVMGKGLRAEYGEYIPPESLGLTPNFSTGEYDVAPAYAEIVARNRANVQYYGVFAQCGSLPTHIHHAVDLDILPLWDYFNRTVSGMSMAEALPAPAETEDYWVYSYDETLSFDEQLKPGDMLVWAAPERPRHFAMYVGNEIAKRYFPNTTGNVVEAGAGPDHFCGVTKDLYDRFKDGMNWLFICRPKNIKVKLHQDLPPLKLNKGCDEGCKPLSVGERMAHCAAGIAMTAVGQADYSAMLANLGILGDGLGEFRYGGGQIRFNTYNIPEWRARQNPIIFDQWVHYIGCACDMDYVTPDPRIPRAQAYIEFTMGKGVLPEYGVYIPEPVCRDPENYEQVQYNKQHISCNNGIPGYSRFAMCGTAVEHVAWAVGVDIEKLVDSHGLVRSGTGGNTWSSGVTPNGIPYVADPPHYCYYFPDHIYGESAPIRGDVFDCWSLDWERPIAEQCKPGDILCIGPAWGDPEPADFVKQEHGLMYVGNDIVRQYFPNSPAIIAQAGGSGVFWGLCADENLKLPKGYRIYRVHDMDVEQRQWVPPIQDCNNHDNWE